MWMTDMGWIMGPWTVMAGMGNGASVVCYDGAPDYPTPGRPWDLVGSLDITILGISPTLVRALQPHGAHHAADADFSTLRAFGSTGEPWNPAPWWWLFRDIGGEGFPIINISGGTEVGACLLSVNILQGIKPVSLGGPCLGMAVEVYDQDGPSYPRRSGRTGVHEDLAGRHPRLLGGRRPLLRHLLGSLAGHVGARRLGDDRRRRVSGSCTGARMTRSTSPENGSVLPRSSRRWWRIRTWS